MAGDDVEKKKPDPSIYRIAAQRLGVDPSECLVVEDSTIGLKVRSKSITSLQLHCSAYERVSCNERPDQNTAVLLKTMLLAATQFVHYSNLWWSSIGRCKI